MTKHCHRGGWQTPVFGRTDLNQKLALQEAHIRKEEEEVRRVRVIYPRDPPEKSLLFSGFALQKVVNESRLPNETSQNLQTLLATQRQVSPLSQPCQSSHPCWF